LVESSPTGTELGPPQPDVLPAPAVKLMKEVGRELTIDPETEAKLLAVTKQPMKDVLIVIQDTGMRDCGGAARNGRSHRYSDVLRWQQ
jgi:hypothetical protein